MNEARQIISALKGHWHGSYGTARCPAHDDHDPSLSVSERQGVTLLHCHAGCDQNAVIEALKARGLWGGSQDPSSSVRSPVRDTTAVKHSEAAREIWRECKPIAGTLAETYLRNRGIEIALPATLRFHPALKHKSGVHLPGMVAAVTRWPDRKVIAIHRTFLDYQGRKTSLSNAKMMLGPCRGGAVRLREHARELVVGEGVETTISVQQSGCLSAWACLSSSGLENVVLPEDARNITIAADNDASGAGQRAAERLSERLKREGRTVRIMLPPESGMDWNDVLMRGAA